MANILSIRAKIAARLGVDITDYHVIPYFDLDDRLIWAAINERFNEVEYLVALGANIHAQNGYALLLAAGNGIWNVVKHIVALGANVNDFVLFKAIETKDLSIIEYLVTHGANIHAQNDLALRWATQNEHWSVVEYLNAH